MSLALRLKEVNSSFYTSVSQLHVYTINITSAIKKIQSNHEEMLKKALQFPESQAYKDIVNHPDYEASDKSSSLTLENIIGAVQMGRDWTFEFPDMTLKMSFIYLISLFDVFLTDSFELILRNRSEMLKSKKQITYEKAIQLASVTNLVEFFAQREIYEVNYMSLNDQIIYYKDRFGVNIADSGIPVNTLIEFRARRNLFVHNNGVVNQIYLDLTSDSRYKIGDVASIDMDYFTSVARALKVVGNFISSSLAKKFT